MEHYHLETILKINLISTPYSKNIRAKKKRCAMCLCRRVSTRFPWFGFANLLSGAPTHLNNRLVGRSVGLMIKQTFKETPGAPTGLIGLVCIKDRTIGGAQNSELFDMESIGDVKNAKDEG